MIYIVAPGIVLDVGHLSVTFLLSTCVFVVRCQIRHMMHSLLRIHVVRCAVSRVAMAAHMSVTSRVILDSVRHAKSKDQNYHAHVEPQHIIRFVASNTKNAKPVIVCATRRCAAASTTARVPATMGHVDYALKKLMSRVIVVNTPGICRVGQLSFPVMKCVERLLRVAITTVLPCVTAAHASLAPGNRDFHNLVPVARNCLWICLHIVWHAKIHCLNVVKYVSVCWNVANIRVSSNVMIRSVVHVKPRYRSSACVARSNSLCHALS
jgi:hypothetical protein